MNFAVGGRCPLSPPGLLDQFVWSIWTLKSRRICRRFADCRRSVFPLTVVTSAINKTMSLSLIQKKKHILSEHQTVKRTAQLKKSKGLVRATHGWQRRQQEKKVSCALDDMFPSFNTTRKAASHKCYYAACVSKKQRARGNACHHPLLFRKEPSISCVNELSKRTI